MISTASRRLIYLTACIGLLVTASLFWTFSPHERRSEERCWNYKDRIGESAPRRGTVFLRLPRDTAHATQALSPTTFAVHRGKVILYDSTSRRLMMIDRRGKVLRNCTVPVTCIDGIDLDTRGRIFGYDTKARTLVIGDVGWQTWRTIQMDDASDEYNGFPIDFFVSKEGNFALLPSNSHHARFITNFATGETSQTDCFMLGRDDFLYERISPPGILRYHLGIDYASTVETIFCPIDPANLIAVDGRGALIFQMNPWTDNVFNGSFHFQCIIAHSSGSEEFSGRMHEAWDSFYIDRENNCFSLYLDPENGDLVIDQFKAPTGNNSKPPPITSG